MFARVQTMRYPSIATPDGWFKVAFFKTTNGFPMGAIWLLLFFGIALAILHKTKRGTTLSFREFLFRAA